MANTIIELKSVGCGIDPNTLITYPKNKDGSYDLESGTHLGDIDSHKWFTCLSLEDLKVVNRLHARDKFTQPIAITWGDVINAVTKKKTKPIKCERCGEVLIHERIIWLELSNTDGNYYETIPDGHISQGGFPFGSVCARKQLKETISKTKDKRTDFKKIMDMYHFKLK